MEWFRHDINAHDDIKIKKIIKKYGFAAVGMYWYLIELIYCAGGRLERSEAVDEISLIDGLTEEDADVSIEELISVGLIFADGTKLGSHRTDSEITFDTDRRRKKSEAGKKGMESRWNHNTVITDDNTSITPDNTLPNHTLPNITPLVSKDTIPPKGRKVFVKPTLDEVKQYCKERGNGIEAENFIDFYESKGWKIGNSPMKDWKAAIRTWESRRKPEIKQRSNKMVEDLEERIRLNHSIDPRTGEPR